MALSPCTNNLATMNYQPPPEGNSHQLIEHLNARIAELERQVENSRRLAELGSLTAAISHEIRGSLNIIQNFTILSAEATDELIALLPTPGSTLTEEQSQTIQEILTDILSNSEYVQNNSLRATQIVNTMLMSSHGRTEQFQPVPLNQLVTNHAKLAYQAVRSQDSGFNVAMEYQLDETVGDIIALPSDIGRAVINIVSNSCHATAERASGDADYRPAIHITTSAHTDYVTLSVRDNGSGMSQAVADRIFTPFFTTKPPEHGTGLGLSITKDIVEKHGGTISAQSQLGSHTVFTIELPRVPPEFQR